MKKILKKLAGAIPYIMLLVSFILILRVGISIKNGETPTIFGKAVFFVPTQSMEDTIMAHDMIFVDTTEDHYTVGDIITFRKPDQEGITITHRIVEINIIGDEKYYTTLGDNNPYSYDWETNFSEANIIGKYLSKSTFLGGIYFYVFENGINVIFIAIILVFITIGGMELFSIIKTINEAKSKDMLEEKEKLIEEELQRLRQEKQEKDK